VPGLEVVASGTINRMLMTATVARGNRVSIHVRVRNRAMTQRTRVRYPTTPLPAGIPPPDVDS
jgi:hypothetical protein